MSTHSRTETGVVEPPDRDGKRGRPDGTATPRLPVVVRYLMVPVLFFTVSTLATMIWALPGLKDWATAHPMGAIGVQIVQWLLAFALSIALAWALMRWVDGRPLSALGWRVTVASGPLLLLGIGLACAVMLGLGLVLAQAELTRFQPAVTGAPAWTLIVSGLFLAFPVQGIPEEVLFRGYLMQTLRHRPIIALVCSSLLFGSIHLISGAGQQNLAERFWYLALPLGLGFAAGAMLLATRSLWPAIGLHAGMHVAFMIGRFTGLADGPWAWVLWGIGFAAIGAVALVFWHRRPAEERREVVINR